MPPITRRSSTRITGVLVTNSTVTTEESRYSSKRSAGKEDHKENVGSVNGASGKRQFIEHGGNRTELHSKDSVLQDQPSPRKCSRSDSLITRFKDNSLDTSSLLSKNAFPCKVSSLAVPSSNESHTEPEEDEILSYEKLRLKNVHDNAEFLASLGIQEAKQNLQRKKEKPKKDKLYQRPRAAKESSPREPTRRSLRVRSIKPIDAVETPSVTYSSVRNRYMERHPPGPFDMTCCLFPSVTENLHNKLRDTVRSACDVEEQVEPLTSSLKSFMEEFKKLNLGENRVIKVVKERIFSLAIHPSENKILVAAGDKWGNLGFWDVESEDDAVTAYTPHTSPINHVEFCQWKPATVFTCSYDGTFRHGDFERAVFSEVYSVPVEEDIMLRSFGFQSKDVVAIAQSDGCVAVVDQRTPGTSAENIYHLHKKGLRALDIHPTNKQYFLTGSVDGSVCLWDMRKMKSKSNVAIATMMHARSVDSACFSPITGNKILSCSSDNTINLFDSSTLNKNITRTHSIKHNNYVGRWLTKFRAVWHPSRDDLFVSGSMTHPRQIEIFSDTGQLLKAFSDVSLNSVCSINMVHPSRNILAGGNSSGRVHVFM
ncbi:WD repeat-containing protein 76-like [Gigantopelta aegis]|uniref:WD repeat-containing protein 76-like n=1 Tax=Gigantopelta aegis TaxID=1735272 RepID=UPI001B8880DD|nr:WD repeat-containing protein 76-like [Gigantopelta aegis]